MKLQRYNDCIDIWHYLCSKNNCNTYSLLEISEKLFNVFPRVELCLQLVCARL